MRHEACGERRAEEKYGEEESVVESVVSSSSLAPRSSLLFFADRWLLFLPIIPSLLVYLSGTPVHYAAYGLPKGLLLGVLILLFIQPRDHPGPGWTLGMVLALLLEMGGFTPLALLAGCSGMISTLRLSILPRGILTLLVVIVLTPFLDGILIQEMRDLSLRLVDGTLNILGILFERQGVVYILEGIRAEIWERCSGYSTARVLVAGWLTLFFLQGQFRRSALLALPLGIISGLAVNLLRIVTHLLLAASWGTPPADIYHVIAGLLAFFLVTALLLVCLLKPERLSGFRMPESIPPWPGGYRGFALGMCLAGLLLVIPGRLVKRIEHSYTAWPDLRLDLAHINSFQEFPGGGGWILLEHDLRHCFRWFGYREQEERLVRAGDEVTVETLYRTGEIATPGRGGAILWRLLRPDQAFLPLEVRILVTEHRKPTSPAFGP